MTQHYMNISANKIGEVFAILILNIPIGLVFMYISPVCYQYLEDDYASFESVAMLALILPIYWVLGAVIFPFIILTLIMLLSTNMEEMLAKLDFGAFLAFCYIIIVIGILSHLIIYWQRITKQIRIAEVLVLSVLLNIIFLQSFFLSMSV